MTDTPRSQCLSMASPSKLVLITGANKGIGFEIARQIAAHHKGYHIVMGSRDVERGAKAAEALQREGLSVEALTIDVTDDRSITAAAEIVKAKFGRLDVLINNAAIAIDGDRICAGRKMFEETFATNNFGAAATTEAFIPLLEKSAAARVVFMSSDLASMGLRAGSEGRANTVEEQSYRCSKAALNMLALGYAQRFRAQGWKVNIHSPGYTATDMTDHRGTGTVEDGARGAVRLATLGEDGETGTFSGKQGTIAW
ncbi:hypothetical protein B0H15DRAFT_833752 [Mycena belliarum]|uniref:Ketoreductase domain-containing protein n=1 Tax=Mycena belliarum TaxID=1033014 RepID=A0AAD6U679_9AGAR|nr:hypothetical protein B0H15DRAFT_833752 [Mycena belliae]